LLKKLFTKFANKVSGTKHVIEPTIIPRSEHSISRNDIHHNALKVLYRLHNAGFKAYLVGGCVRDILLGRHPKDFDVATNALPEEIQGLFRNCRLIGKRFRLAHIVFGREIIEVATFRTHHKETLKHLGHTNDTGMLVRDNVYGSIEDDAWRRDFTINALYYNIADFSLVDYTNGIVDLNHKMIRVIGDATQRFHEDPVRILRAIRFAGKLNLEIDAKTSKPMLELSHLLSHVAPSRLFLEVVKYFGEGATLQTYKLLIKYNLFPALFPQTAAALDDPTASTFIEEALANTDQRHQDGKTISPAFLFAVFLWPAIKEQLKKPSSDELPHHVKFELTIRKVLQTQLKSLSIPKALLHTIQEICFLQHRLTRCLGSAPFRLLTHPRFRAGYDLFLLRNDAGEPLQKLTTWWMKFYAGTQEQRDELVLEMKPKSSPKRKKRTRAKKPILPTE
jgi:poly(A) polymerase